MPGCGAAISTTAVDTVLQTSRVHARRASSLAEVEVGPQLRLIANAQGLAVCASQKFPLWCIVVHVCRAWSEDFASVCSRAYRARPVSLTLICTETIIPSSQTFIFTLCQMGVRANITKALDLGPSRQMLGLSSLGSMAERAEKIKSL